jgi:hypothetical protein
MASALVAKLKKQAGVRDPEALAAWIGRYKKARKAGMSVAKAKAAAGGGDSGGSPKTGDDAPGKYGISKRLEASARASLAGQGYDVGNGGRRAKAEENQKFYDDKKTGAAKKEQAAYREAQRKMDIEKKEISSGSLVASYNDTPAKVERVRADGFLETDEGRINPNFTRNVSGDPVAKKMQDEKRAQNAREIEQIKSKHGWTPQAPIKEADSVNRDKSGASQRVTGSTDPAKMTNDELNYFIQWAEMAQNARAQTQEIRSKMAARLLKLYAEKKRRQDRRAQGYNY